MATNKDLARWYQNNDTEGDANGFVRRDQDGVAPGGGGGEDKLDKVTDVTAHSQVYGKVANGNQTMYDVSSSALNDTLAYRHEGGRLTVGTPADDSDAATKKYVDENAGGGMQMDLLWENANPSADFYAQTLTIDLREYSAVSMIYSAASTYKHTIFIPIKNATTHVSVQLSDDSYTSYSPNYKFTGRTMSILSNKQAIDFSNGSSNGAASHKTCSPYKIYGIK